MRLPSLSLTHLGVGHFTALGKVSPCLWKPSGLKGLSYRTWRAKLAAIQKTKKRHKIFGELRNIWRGILVYTCKTTRGVGD